MGVIQILSPDSFLTSKSIHKANFSGMSLRRSIVMPEVA